MNKKESNKVNSFNTSDAMMLKSEPNWKGSVNITKQFGSIQEKISLVETTLTNLKKVMPRPQLEIDESKTATSNLETLMVELNEMFKEIDKFIAPCEYTQPDFY